MQMKCLVSSLTRGLAFVRKISSRKCKLILLKVMKKLSIEHLKQFAGKLEHWPKFSEKKVPKYFYQFEFR